MKKILSFLIPLLLVGCNDAVVRQNDDNFDNRRLEIFQAERTALTQLQSMVAKEAMITCKTDSNPGLCANGVMDKMMDGLKEISTRTAPQRTIRPVSPGWQIANNLTKGLPGYLLRGYEIKTNSDLSRDLNRSDNEFWSGALQNAGDSAGTHLGDGAQLVQGNQDNSVDNSVDVGRDQYEAGGDIVNGQIGDTAGGDQNQVGGDQNQGPIVTGDFAEGDNNFNSGRIDSPGSFDSRDCVADSDSDAGAGGDGGNGGNTGTTGAGGAGGSGLPGGDAGDNSNSGCTGNSGDG